MEPGEEHISHPKIHQFSPGSGAGKTSLAGSGSSVLSFGEHSEGRDLRTFCIKGRG